MFMRMYAQSKETYEKSLFTTSLRALVAGVMCRPGAKQSARYWGKEFPELRDIAVKVKEHCTNLLQKISAGLCIWQDANDVQKAIVVASQVLMPPMRGKPFWSLSLTDNGENSMYSLETKKKKQLLPQMSW